MTIFDMEDIPRQILNFKFPLYSNYTGRLTTHETIKAQLHYLAFKYNLFPLPESYVYLKTNKRIDMLWINEYKTPIAAFEIDSYVSPASVKKLIDLSVPHTFIISLSSRKNRFEEGIKKAKAILKDYPKQKIIIISLGLKIIVPVEMMGGEGNLL